MIDFQNDILLDEFRKLEIEHDSVRFIKLTDTIYVVIGHMTDPDPNTQIIVNGDEVEPQPYLKESVIACGENTDEVITDLKSYKRLSELSFDNEDDHFEIFKLLYNKKR